MKVRVRLFCYEISTSVKENDFELPDGSNVRTLMHAVYDTVEGKTIIERDDFVDQTSVMIDGTVVGPNTVLSDGQMIMLMRSAEGG